jgi:hypothetical protein
MTKPEHYTKLLAKHGVKKSHIARLLFPNSTSPHSSLCNWFNGRVKNPNWGLIDIILKGMRNENAKTRK